jgi:hypothetical protein
MFYRSPESGFSGFINFDFINGNFIEDNLLLVRSGDRFLDFITGSFRSGNGTNQSHTNNESQLYQRRTIVELLTQTFEQVKNFIILIGFKLMSEIKIMILPASLAF